MKLKDSIRYIKGVGPAKEELFNKVEIKTVEDLINYFPRDYEDRTIIKKLFEVVDGEKVSFEAEIQGSVSTFVTRNKLRIIKANAFDDTAKITMTWFNADYVRTILKPGKKYVFYGTIERNMNGLSITNPIFEDPDAHKKTGKILPIYPLTKGLTQNMIRDAITNVFDNLSEEILDVIPESIRLSENLADIKYALEYIHFPIDTNSYIEARKRLAFEELLTLQLGLMQIKKAETVNVCGINFEIKEETKEFINNLPFKLTNAQNKVVKDILNDMNKDKPMRRLLQGDVGSGKTIVSLIAILNAVKNGYQAALMAPTSILADQHLETFNAFLKDENIRVALLTSSLTAKEKRTLKEKIELGLIDVVIGTHAVLEDDVRFYNLGLVVTDEQHRFGVKQRGKLTEKGNNPDTLVMTATPIPRTLALILYGDLDISIIDELPPNRKKIDTFLVDETMEERINNFIEKEIGEGRQAYVVCPLIEEMEDASDNAKLKNVLEAEKNYKKRFPNMNIEILHGKMKPALKDDIMYRFKNKEIDILISTTVIEVGVNVPNATLMIVENAERFGLAALHQLRGRVGRGEAKSYCILKCFSKGKQTLERMKIMTQSDNGFKIAEKDLELRGPGEFLGVRQHGMPEFKIANVFADTELLERTTVVAKQIIDSKENYEQLLDKSLEKFCEVVL
ncbi:MAG: ATP-dependent DNA helicase RecG [Clostridia bacterium]|nr:ATP-dependent DNA helicase RecG [Clostridia bacterium]